MTGNDGELLVWIYASWITNDVIVCNQKENNQESSPRIQRVYIIWLLIKLMAL